MRTTTSTEELIDFVYPHFSSEIFLTAGRAIIALRNREVGEPNDKIQRNCRETIKHFFSRDKLDAPEETAGNKIRLPSYNI